MTKDIDLSTMNISRKILPLCREQVRSEIKNRCLWAFGQNAFTEMTETIREKTSFPPLYKLYPLFHLHNAPKKNVKHSRAIFFDLKKQYRKSVADVWKRILEDEKNCEFETIAAAELLATMFLSLIGKSTGHYELSKQIRKSDMSVEAITDAIH